MSVKKEGFVFGGGNNKPRPSPAGEIRDELDGFRVDFDRDKFGRILKDKGYDVLWEKALACPYRGGANPRDHRIDCNFCSYGYLYFDPKETTMLMTSLSLEQNYYAYGRWDTGKQMVTAMPEYKMAMYDRLTMLKARARFTEILIRNPSTMRDRPKYNPIEMETVQWVDRADTLRVYQESVDFTVDATTGEIVWSASTRPDDRSYYAVSYFHRPQFIIIDLPNQIRDSKVKTEVDDESYEFPVKAVAQFDFLVRDERTDPVDEDVRTNPFQDP